MYYTSIWHFLFTALLLGIGVGALIVFLEDVIEIIKDTVAPPLDDDEELEINRLDEELEIARHELQQAMKAFDNVSERYIDSAIYKWKAAEERYTKLLEEYKNI